MRRTLFEGKFLRLLDEESWEFADRPASAGIVSVVVSFPGGLIDRAEAGRRQETAIEAGRRELREETGYEAGKIEELVNGPISPGMTTEVVTFVLAENLVQVGAQMLDAHEDIALHRVPLPRLSDWLGTTSTGGSRVDLKVFVGLYFLRSRGLLC